MSTIIDTVRTTAAEWLASGEIELFIGWERGSIPLRATPVFIRKPEDVERLIWDATCENNLVAFLPKPQYRGKKIGIMVKGCDSRAINGLIQEGQIKRENLRIIGVSCPGVLAIRKVAAALEMPVDDIAEGTLQGDQVIVEGVTLALGELLHDVCLDCTQHNPIVCDVQAGEELSDELAGDPFAKVHEMEALDADQRWARFAAELSKCNLCFACRNACPMCYCNVCFVDQTMPKWFNQTSAPEDVQFYQIMRTFHLAGRCVGCGACTRACPQGVDIRLWLDKLRVDVNELYDYVAGTDPKAKPPLTTYSQDDYNDFIL